MPDFGARFHLAMMNRGNTEVYMLRERFESFASSRYTPEACEGIALCLRQLGQFVEAGGWYEAAGKLVFDRQELRPELRALLAVEEYEKAVECYRDCGDAGAEADCSTVLAGLKRACAPA